MHKARYVMYLWLLDRGAPTETWIDLSIAPTLRLAAQDLATFKITPTKDKQCLYKEYGTEKSR
jgi:hypothetical protein